MQLHKYAGFANGFQMVISKAQAAEWSSKTAPQQAFIIQPGRCVLQLIPVYEQEDSIILIDLWHIKSK